MSVFAGPEVVTTNLRLHFDAANVKSYPGTGNSWTDLVQGKVSALNGAIFDAANGGTISFDGIDDSSSAPSLGLVDLTQLTVNVWFYSDVAFNMGLVRSLSVGNAFILHYRGAGFYLTADDGTTSGYLGWQTTAPAFQWLMLTGTWDGTTMRLYRNAVKQTNELAFAGGANGTLADVNTIQLGYYFNPSQPWTAGRIAMCSIYDRELSQAEINYNFKAIAGRFGL